MNPIAHRPRWRPLWPLLPALVMTLACARTETSARILDRAALGRQEAWHVTFRYGTGFTLENVPRDDGATAAVEWSGRSEGERLFRNELAYLLAVHHGVRIAPSRAEATGLLALLTIASPTLLESDAIGRVDVYFMDPDGTESYAQVSIENKKRLGPAVLAEVAAEEVARVLGVAGTGTRPEERR